MSDRLLAFYAKAYRHHVRWHGRDHLWIWRCYRLTEGRRLAKFVVHVGRNPWTS